MKVVASCLDFQKILWDFPIFSPQLSNWLPQNRWPKTTLELVPLLAIWPFLAPMGVVTWQDFWSHPYWIDSFRSTGFKGLLLVDRFTKDSDFPIVFVKDCCWIVVVPRRRCHLCWAMWRNSPRCLGGEIQGIMMIHQIWCSDEADQEFTSQSQIRRPRYLMGIQEDTRAPTANSNRVPGAFWWSRAWFVLPVGWDW